MQYNCVGSGRFSAPDEIFFNVTKKSLNTDLNQPALMNIFGVIKIKLDSKNDGIGTYYEFFMQPESIIFR